MTSGMLSMLLPALGIKPEQLEAGLAQAQQLGAAFASLVVKVDAVSAKLDAIGLHVGAPLPVSPELLARAAEHSADKLAQLEHDAAEAASRARGVDPASAFGQFRAELAEAQAALSHAP